MTNILKARRKLDELYRKGVEVRFGPGPDGPVGRIAPKGEGYFVDDDGEKLPLGDDEIAMWVQPPNPQQREMALRDAQAARSRALLRVKRDPESEEHLTTLAFLADMSDETLFEYVLLNNTETRRQAAMREVLAEDKWENITELQDAQRLFEEEPPQEGTPQWEEKLALDKLDDEFGDELRVREDSLRDAELEVLRMKGRAGAEKQAMERRADIAGSQAFMYEYERKMLFYSVRDPEQPAVLFFESATQLAEQDEEIQLKLGEALDPFIGEVGEAKNSPRAASGSTSSEPPSKPETSDPSIPQELSA